MLVIKKKDDQQKKIMSFLKKHPTIDGIIAADSSSGIIALNTAIKLGLKVPKNVSVIGYASKSDSYHTIPKLTTIRQHAKEIGASAAQMLINRLQNKTAEEDVRTKIIKTTLIKSKSTLN